MPALLHVVTCTATAARWQRTVGFSFDARKAPDHHAAPSSVSAGHEFIAKNTCRSAGCGFIAAGHEFIQKIHAGPGCKRRRNGCLLKADQMPIAERVSVTKRCHPLPV